MDVNVDEQAILDKLYESTKDWVSVEVELNKTMKPSVLFHLTEKDAGDRFYMRLNDNYSSYFGYHAIHRFKNDFENKQSIFKDWEKLKNNIELIHPHNKYHHLRLCGGFQFSSHKSDDEWREYGLNHFVLPKVLISNEGTRTYLTYTTKRQDFDLQAFKTLVAHFEQTTMDNPEETLGDVTRMEDIYKDDWRELVKEAIDTIDDNKKIVLARRRLVKFDKKINIPYVLNRALENEKNSYIFLLEANQSIFFSQTPEQLIKVEDGVLSTKAVAGTIKQDVEYNETPNILKNDHMYHLYTEIKANLNDKSYIGLIDRLHPTPALGGYPKEEALDFIENKEFGTRGLYGAPVGYIDVYDDCEFIVAIRSMLIKEQQATLYAGCGIVKNSDPDSEVAETAVKFSPMMNALGVDNNDES